jgi:hydrogenase expression/formation protein HypC
VNARKRNRIVKFCNATFWPLAWPGKAACTSQVAPDDFQRHALKCAVHHFGLWRSSQITLAADALLMAGEPAVCLAIPGKILEVRDIGEMRVARVQFGGVERQVSLVFVPEVRLGDYVMVHVGFAISHVDSVEAERTYQFLQDMGELEAESPLADPEVC